MLGGAAVLLLLVGGAVAAFPPETFGAAAAKFQIKPQTYEVVFKVGDQFVAHINDRNGDRLRLSATKFDVMVMYVVNNGYVFKSLWSKDLLCINWSKSFKMLSYPSTPNLPADCVVRMERLGTASDSDSELKYERVGAKLCVQKSDIEAGSKYRLFVQQGSVKYYLKVGTSLLSTTDSGKASEFTVQYTRCREDREVGNFVCRILYRKGGKCRQEEDFVREHSLWKRQIEERLTPVVITTTLSSVTGDISSSITTPSRTTTTTSKSKELVYVSPVYEEEEEEEDDEERPSLVDNISTSVDDSATEPAVSTHFWCSYVDVLCSSSAAELNNQNCTLILFIFFLINIFT